IERQLESKHTKKILKKIILTTGLFNPKIDVLTVEEQIYDIIREIHQRTEKDERVLITTLTKRMAEDLTDYLKEMNIRVAYLHSEIKTLERIEIIRDLRVRKYDVLVGIK